MKARLFFICLLTTVLLSLISCSSAVDKELLVDIDSSGTEVTLASGGRLIVTLESDIVTGYSWDKDASLGDNTVIQQIDYKYQRSRTPIPGVGGNQVWTFKALKAGKSTILIEYRRLAVPSMAPAKTFTLTVVVQ